MYVGKLDNAPDWVPPAGDIAEVELKGYDADGNQIGQTAVTTVTVGQPFVQLSVTDPSDHGDIAYFDVTQVYLNTSDHPEADRDRRRRAGAPVDAAAAELHARLRRQRGRRDQGLTSNGLVSNVGIAACVDLDVISGGIGFYWGGSFSAFSGCDLSPNTGPTFVT